MTVSTHIQGILQAAIGEAGNGIARENTRPALLSASSVEAITAGLGVCWSSSALGDHHPLVILPTLAGEFAGIVPADAIPSNAEAALYGSTAGQVRPGKAFCVGVADPRGAKWIVPLAAGTSTAGNQAFLVYSGANAGKWAISDLGVQPVYLLEVVSGGSDAVGFSATIGGVAGVSLSKTSVSAAADAPALAALWNANAYYRAFGVATVGGSNDVVITGNAYTAISFTDTSTGANSITPSTTTALVAPTARAIPGARFRVSSATKTVLELA